MTGRADERMLSDDRNSKTTYGLFTLDKRYAGFGAACAFSTC